MLEAYFYVNYFFYRKNILCSLTLYPKLEVGGKTNMRKTLWRSLSCLGPIPLRPLLWIPSRNNVGNYEDQYMRWTTLRQERGQAVPEFTNTFHTLRTKLGIKDSERHLVLKYRGALHRYILTEMGFLDMSSLGAAY